MDMRGQRTRGTEELAHCTLLGSINPRKVSFCSTETLLKKLIVSPSLFNELHFQCATLFQIHSFSFLFHNSNMAVFFIKPFSIGLIHPLSCLLEFIVTGDQNIQSTKKLCVQTELICAAPVSAKILWSWGDMKVVMDWQNFPNITLETSNELTSLLNL